MKLTTTKATHRGIEIKVMSEASPNDSFGRALAMMHENLFRHVPVVENGEPVGIVSARYALDPDMEEFVSEVQRRKAFL